MCRYILITFLLNFYVLSAQNGDQNSRTIYLMNDSVEKADAYFDAMMSTLNSDTELARQYGDTSLQVAKNIAAYNWLKNESLIKGIIKNVQGRYEESVTLLETYLNEPSLKDSTKLGIGFINLSSGYERLENLEKSISYSQQAIDVFERLHDETQLASSYNSLAINYRKLKQYDKARAYYFKALALHEKNNNAELLSDVLCNIGNTYGWEGNFDLTEEYYRKAIAIDSSYNNRRGLYYDYENMGNLYGRKGDIKKALEFFKKGISYVKDTDRKFEYTNGTLRLGQVYMMTNDYESALATFDEALTPALQENYADIITTIYKNKANCFAKLGHYKEAYDLRIAYSNIHDSVLNATVLQKVTEANVKYETIEKEKEIAILNKDKELTAFQLSASNRRNIGLTAVLLIISGLLLSLFRLFKKTKAQNLVISKALKEKEILLREIHHRVKNNLQFVSSLLGLQTEHITDKKALGALQEGQDRVQSMALIHQNLYQEENLTGVDMKAYFIKLLRGLFDSYNIKKEQISLDLDIGDVNLDVDTVIPVGLIANELVSNSLKYAFPKKRNGTISIALKEIQDKLSLEVADDGIGMSDEMIGQLGSSFGYRLVNVFKDQLNATIHIDGSEGTTVKMTIGNYKKAL